MFEPKKMDVPARTHPKILSNRRDRDCTSRFQFIQLNCEVKSE